MINDSKLKMTSPHVSFCPQPKAIQFTVTEVERNHMIKVAVDYLNS